MTTVDTVFAEMLLRIIPDVFFWALLGIIAFLVMLGAFRIPKSTSAFLAFMWIYVLANSIGGYFIVLNMIMLMATAISLIAALYKLGGRGQ